MIEETNSLYKHRVMQRLEFDRAYEEIKSGLKRSHWIWFIFPQLRGLGKSVMSLTYDLKDVDEAIEYTKDDYLMNNLLKITEALYECEKDDIHDIVGSPDDKKIKSCMTLFSHITNYEIFKKVLHKYYGDKQCEYTLNKLNEKLIK